MGTVYSAQYNYDFHRFVTTPDTTPNIKSNHISKNQSWSVIIITNNGAKNKQRIKKVNIDLNIFICPPMK